MLVVIILESSVSVSRYTSIVAYPAVLTFGASEPQCYPVPLPPWGSVGLFGILIPVEIRSVCSG